MRDTEPEAIDCPAIDGIVEEADDVAGKVEDTRVPPEADIDGTIILIDNQVAENLFVGSGLKAASSRRPIQARGECEGQRHKWKMVAIPITVHRGSRSQASGS
jgi:hypothetical protein